MKITEKWLNEQKEGLANEVLQLHQEVESAKRNIDAKEGAIQLIDLALERLSKVK